MGVTSGVVEASRGSFAVGSHGFDVGDHFGVSLATPEDHFGRRDDWLDG